MVNHIRTVSQAVIGLPEALVISAAQEQADRFGLAVAGEDIAKGVDRQAEWIDLPVREELNVRAVRAEAVDVPGVHRDLRAIGATDSGSIFEPVDGIDESVEAFGE